MKVIIAGSRNITNINIDEIIKKSKFDITTLLCGMAKGIDSLSYMWAMKNNIHIIKYYPDWNKYGVAAGPIRNKKMVDYADALIAVWDGVSKGTKSTINFAKEKGIQIYIEKVIK